MFNTELETEILQSIVLLTCTKDDLIGGQPPDGDGRLREALVRQVRWVGKDDFELGTELLPAGVGHLREENVSLDGSRAQILAGNHYYPPDIASISNRKEEKRS